MVNQGNSNNQAGNTNHPHHYNNSKKRHFSQKQGNSDKPKEPQSAPIQLKLKKHEEIKPVFAAYFNLARMNMYNTLVNISNCVGFENGEDEENMSNMTILNKRLKADQANSLRRLLYIHFPFLKILNLKGNNSLYDNDDHGLKEELSANINDLQAAIKNIVRTLNYYRNYYSHYKFKSEKIKEKNFRLAEEIVGYYLRNIITAAPRAVKERFKGDKNKQQEGLLPDGALDFIHKGKTKTTGYGDNKKTEWLKSYFLYPLRNAYEHEMLDDSSNPDRLSTIGLILLCSIFLEKKYINELLQQSGFFNADIFQCQTQKAKGSISLSKQSIMLEIFSIYRIVLPQRKLDIDKGEIQVALDMVNELKKCPDELFDLLSSKDKEQFAITSENNERILLRRHSDRFPQLLLYYLDTTKAFNSIRFHINGGKFRYLFNENKICIDGGERIRVLQEDLNCFYRLNEFEQKRLLAKTESETGQKSGNTIWREYDIKSFEEAPKDNAKCLPYISDVQSHYIFNGDNIGIRFRNSSNEVNFIPDITKTEKGLFKAATVEPDCWMSKYELPAMAFHYYLYKKCENKSDFTSTEEIVGKYIDNYRKFFGDISEGNLTPSCTDIENKIKEDYNINWSDIPDKIKEYLLGKTCDLATKKANYKLKLVEQLKQETERRISNIAKSKKQVEGNDNKPGKKGFTRILPGNLAIFLARDILYFQNYQNASDKLTGLNYNVLQAVLATFSPRNAYRSAEENNKDKALRVSNLDELKNVLEANGAKLLSTDTHPFLKDVCKGHTIVDTLSFYEAYLNGRKKFLENIWKKLLNNKDCEYSFFHTKKAKWQERNDQYYKDLAKRYIDNNASIFLPRQLFDNEIVKLLAQYPELKETLSGEKHNVTYLIREFFSTVLKDDVQEFYGDTPGKFEHKHNYNFFNIVRHNPKKVNALISSARKNLESCTDSETIILRNGNYYNELVAAKKWCDENPENNNNNNNRKHGNNDDDQIPVETRLRNSYRRYTETEKVFRRYRVQDILMFLLAKDIIEKNIGNNDNKDDFKLKEITPKGGSILDKKVTIETGFTIKSKNKEGKEITVQKNISQKDVPVKEYGEIYKLLYDSRFQSLAIQLDEPGIDANEIKNELEKYNKSRIGIFTRTLSYEGRIYKANKEELETIKELSFADVQKKDGVMKPIDKESLRLIRNAFAHNHYPPAEVIDKDDDKVKTTLFEKSLPAADDNNKGPAIEILEETNNLTSKKEQLDK